MVEKGVIIFGAPGNSIFKEIVDNKTVWQGGFESDPTISGNSSLVGILEMTGDIADYSILYNITILGPNHVKLTGWHILNNERGISGYQGQNNTIDLIRDVKSQSLDDILHSGPWSFVNATNGTGGGIKTGTMDFSPFKVTINGDETHGRHHRTGTRVLTGTTSITVGPSSLEIYWDQTDNGASRTYTITVLSQKRVELTGANGDTINLWR